jgi:hypothetical protein|tara:strand:+ start:189 stop:464 length:276 start_codon:yes stop_codon:yes gene_type:complete
MSLMTAFSISGLSEAIIGVGVKASGEEVLVYNAQLVETILERSGCDLTLTGFIQDLELAGLGDRAPVFVYIDENLEEKLEVCDFQGSDTLH